MVLFVVFLCVSGCHTREHEVLGTWDWNNEVVHFDRDGVWGAFEKTNPTHWENWGGNWTTGGNSVTLSMTVIDPPEGHDVEFMLSPDGRRMTGVKTESGIMIKR
jgi:hypothetical protein